MHETIYERIPKVADCLFHFVILLYPGEYRERFGLEMYTVLQDMYEDELEEKGRVSSTFWLSQFVDIIRSILEQHMQAMQKKGMRKYLQQTLHINSYNIIGGILLLPLLCMIAIDIVSRIVQGNLAHYNRPVYVFLSHTPLYWYPVIFSWAILFPLVAFLLNLIPLTKYVMKKRKTFFSLSFVKQNAGNLLLVVMALGFLALIKLHDVVPCVFGGLRFFGIFQFFHILAICRNA